MGSRRCSAGTGLWGPGTHGPASMLAYIARARLSRGHVVHIPDPRLLAAVAVLCMWARDR
jgi:hypothetical protein